MRGIQIKLRAQAIPGSVHQITLTFTHINSPLMFLKIFSGKLSLTTRPGPKIGEIYFLLLFPIPETKQITKGSLGLLPCSTFREGDTSGGSYNYSFTCSLFTLPSTYKKNKSAPFTSV
jgi:hypothetical protein